MPPTFFLFIASIIYLSLSLITLIVFVPMLLIYSKRILAKKVIATVLISFPCLMATGIFWAIVFFIPALIFAWFTHQDYIPETPEITLTILGFLTFLVTVSSSALYFWYFTSKIIYQKIDLKPVSEFLDTDKVYAYLRPYLIKFKLFKQNFWQWEQSVMSNRNNRFKMASNAFDSATIIGIQYISNLIKKPEPLTIGLKNCGWSTLCSFITFY